MNPTYREILKQPRKGTKKTERRMIAAKKATGVKTSFDEEVKKFNNNKFVGEILEKEGKEGFVLSLLFVF